MKLSIAIIGLGRVGSLLLQQILRFRDKGLEIVAVSEPAETPGCILAKSQNIPNKPLEEVGLLGESVDIIFELTGKPELRQSLRNLLEAKKNHHTIVASETIASLICLMLTDKDLPDVHAHKGY
jgi:predicted dinucleotide-utilizing enzyme